MPLRPSQVETLRLVADASPEMGVLPKDLPYKMHINERQARDRLERLERRGLIELQRVRWSMGSRIPAYRLTQLGREALEGR